MNDRAICRTFYIMKWSGKFVLWRVWLIKVEHASLMEKGKSFRLRTKRWFIESERLVSNIFVAWNYPHNWIRIPFNYFTALLFFLTFSSQVLIFFVCFPNHSPVVHINCFLLSDLSIVCHLLRGSTQSKYCMYRYYGRTCMCKCSQQAILLQGEIFSLKQTNKHRTCTHLPNTVNSNSKSFINTRKNLINGYW